MNKIATPLLIILVILTTIACGLFSGTSPEPPYYGAFFRDGKDFIEIPEREYVSGGIGWGDFPIAPDSQPTIVFWNSGLQLQYLQFFNMGADEELRYRVDENENGVLEMRPVDPLDEGLYCFVQGNPLASFLSAWCFQVGDIFK